LPALDRFPHCSFLTPHKLRYGWSITAISVC
jgi:hypothetical protein